MLPNYTWRKTCLIISMATTHYDLINEPNAPKHIMNIMTHTQLPKRSTSLLYEAVTQPAPNAPKHIVYNIPTTAQTLGPSSIPLNPSSHTFTQTHTHTPPAQARHATLSCSFHHLARSQRPSLRTRRCKAILLDHSGLPCALDDVKPPCRAASTTNALSSCSITAFLAAHSTMQRATLSCRVSCLVDVLEIRSRERRIVEE